MRKILLVASMFLLASSSVASVDQRKASQVSDRQALVKQATQGSAEAQYQLGLLYLRVSEGHSEHTRIAEVQDKLGFYMKSEGSPQDNIEAAKWFRKAAEQGHAYAQGTLGMMYAIELAVPQDMTKAAKWFREAAEQGEADSQAAIATLYYHGLGVSQSKVFAYQWAKISIINPSLSLSYRSHLQELLDTLTAELAPTEIAEAEKLAKQWEARAGDGSQNTQ